MFCPIFKKSSSEASGRRQASPINNVLVFDRRNCGLAKIQRVLKKVLFFPYQWHIYLAMPTFHISHHHKDLYNATIKCAICFPVIPLRATPWLVYVKLISTSVSMTAVKHQFWWEKFMCFQSFLSWENGIIFQKLHFQRGECVGKGDEVGMNFVNNFHDGKRGGWLHFLDGLLD